MINCVITLSKCFAVIFAQVFKQSNNLIIFVDHRLLCIRSNCIGFLVFCDYICRNVKQIFKGNDDAKSTSKQELPEPVEAKYIRIYPVEYEGWMCLRAELYGKGTYCTKARNTGIIVF